jgi:hypothetical protein
MGKKIRDMVRGEIVEIQEFEDGVSFKGDKGW